MTAGSCKTWTLPRAPMSMMCVSRMPLSGWHQGTASALVTMVPLTNFRLNKQQGWVLLWWGFAIVATTAFAFTGLFVVCVCTMWTFHKTYVVEYLCHTQVQDKKKPSHRGKLLLHTEELANFPNVTSSIISSLFTSVQEPVVHASVLTHVIAMQ